MSRAMVPVLATAFAAASLASAQEPGQVPVYPGARLMAEPPEAGEQPACCSFSTRDAFSGVVSFYEKALRQKAMDPKALEKAYPALKQIAEAAKRNQPFDAGPAPADAQVRIFVLATEQVPGLGRMPTETFAVAFAGGQTFFEIPEARLGPGGEKYLREFRQKLGLTSAEERAEKEWNEAHPPARQERYSLPVYPGAVVSDEQYRSANCYNAVHQTRDPFEKVVAFYRERLKGKLPESDVNGREGYEGLFVFIDYRYGIAEPTEHDLPGTRTRVLGKRGSVNRYVEIERIGPEQQEAAGGRGRGDPAGVQINLMHTVLDAACADIPRDAVWKENEKVDPRSYSGFRIRGD